MSYRYRKSLQTCWAWAVIFCCCASCLQNFSLRCTLINLSRKLWTHRWYYLRDNDDIPLTSSRNIAFNHSDLDCININSQYITSTTSPLRAFLVLASDAYSLFISISLLYLRCSTKTIITNLPSWSLPLLPSHCFQLDGLLSKHKTLLVSAAVAASWKSTQSLWFVAASSAWTPTLVCLLMNR